MGQESRKATDVLLDVESKISTLLDIIRAQDLNIKILSNKLNDVINRLDKQQATPPKIIVETTQATSPNPPSVFTQMPVGDPERTIPIVPEMSLPQSDVPQGFRRNSRPETYVNENKQFLTSNEERKMPVQLPPKLPSPTGRQQMTPPPGRSPAEVNVPLGAVSKKMAAAPAKQAEMPNMTEQQPMPISAQNQIPVQQRCVDKNGKSVYLAPVEITDLSTSQPVFKTRTNGTGKWMASLGIGTYRIVITKQATQNKEKLEAVQDIQVDGSQSPLELPMFIIK